MILAGLVSNIEQRILRVNNMVQFDKDLFRLVQKQDYKLFGDILAQALNREDFILVLS